MLAASFNARIQAALAPHIYGRSNLGPLPATQGQTLRTRLGPTLAQGSSGAAGTPKKDPFFNRFSEKGVLKTQLKKTPGPITVLVGPPNCGKTRFLRELADELELMQSPPAVIYIDSRLTKVNGPEEISKALSQEVTPVLSKIKTKFPAYLKVFLEAFSVAAAGNMAVWEMLKMVVGDGKGGDGKGGDVKVALTIEHLEKFMRIDENELSKTLKKLEVLFEALTSLPSKPVLVIDEANRLMDWKEPDTSQPQLSDLLAFFISMSKQNRLVHVILATSDYFLASWLPQHGMTEDKFEVQVLGDLTEEEALVFVLGDGANGKWPGIIKDSSSVVPVPAGAEEQWPAIYERCGGNIGLLQQCVSIASVWENWDNGLQQVVAGPRRAIVRGLKPEVYFKKGGVAPLWTTDQWKAVLKCITTAPHHAVLVNEIEKKLEETGEGKGSEILLSMVKYNLLAYRPYSALARDLPREVYKNGLGDVVTLPLPVHVWAAKDVLNVELKDSEAKSSDPNTR